MFNFSKYRFSKKAKHRAELRALKITLAVAVGVLLAGWLVLMQTGKDKMRITEMRDQAMQVQADKDVPPSTAKIGGPFSLTDQDNKPVTDANYRGKYLLVYFGYTYCPDMCPTGLQSMAKSFDQLGADVSKVQGLFITIDPDRDTPAKLKEYTSSFHPKIVGLTGSAQQISSVAKEYQVYYKKGEQVDEHDYVMDHSSLIYLMNPDGKFIATFQEDVDPATLTKALQTAFAAQTPAKP
ncbi:MAG TPA: SCO family protein [Alphaproteobacteria bacterium]|nr:SCO family protein [Alphaproteobacteria bacterium]